MTEEAVRVGFIAGAGRSGSTLLEGLLAQMDGVVSVGELSWLWTTAWESMTCECGEGTQDCEFWAAVLTDAFGRGYEERRRQISDSSSRLIRHRRAVRFLRRARKRPDGDEISEISAGIGQVYGAVARVAGASLVIDATKLGLWGITASLAAGLDFRVVHLVRDPRAYVFSWTRARQLTHLPGASMATRRPSKSVLMWLTSNAEAELLKRRVSSSMLLLYDDLVERPESALGCIARFLELPDEARALTCTRGSANGRFGHAIAGNPTRSTSGSFTIAGDEEWRTTQSRTTNLLVLAGAGPAWSYYAMKSGKDRARQA